MDWPSHVNPFLFPNYQDLFTCDFPSKDNASCCVLEVYGTDGLGDLGQQLVKIDFLRQEHWDKWFNECAIFSKTEELVLPSELPASGVCILFIPSAEDIAVPGDKSLAPNLTDLPITKANWDRLSKAFYLLPSHIVKAISRKTTSLTSIARGLSYEDGTKDKLWMNIAMTSAQGPDTFAVASTHIERNNITLAMMIGCSAEQIKRVQYLLMNSEDAITHPLLMLGICTELQLERLKKLVTEKVTKCLETTRLLEASRFEEDESTGEITWDLINRVRTSRDESERAEEEVKATKRQLLGALPPALRRFISQGQENNGAHDYNVSSSGAERSRAVSVVGSEDDRFEEVTNMFSERFADIFAQFEGLIAECRISAAEMSFMTDIIRSELARQESKSSVKEDAKTSTVITFIAMLYLPMTTVATIFAMPVFQFPNDWRDWRFHEVSKGNSSSSDSSNSNTPNPPIFSGYFWIYLAVSLGATLLTIEGWWRFTSGDVQRRKGKHWTRYIGHKIWISMMASFVKRRSHLPSTKSRKNAQQTPGLSIDRESSESEPKENNPQTSTGRLSSRPPTPLTQQQSSLSAQAPPPQEATPTTQNVLMSASSPSSQAPALVGNNCQSNSPTLQTDGVTSTTTVDASSATSDGNSANRQIPAAIENPVVLRGGKARRFMSMYDVV